MSWPLIVALYVTAWGICLFFTLPFGNAPSEQPQAGHAEGAPAKANLRLKCMVTTLLALVVTLSIVGLKQSGYFSFTDG